MIKRIIRRLLRKHITRLKNHRHRKFVGGIYAGERFGHYRHSTVLSLSGQDRLVSIIVPCFDTPAKYFEPLLSSVFAQGYQNWELVLVDASSDEERAAYIEKRSKADTRIRYIRTKNDGIAGNTNKGINAAIGKYIAFLDHDDTLDPDALAESVAVLDTYPEYDLVYSDEDKISEDGERYFGPHYKPGFSLDMLRNLNYITHFVVVRKEVVDKLGGIRTGFDGAQDYDFLLRVVDEGFSLAHIPKILYHWREAEGSTAADFSSKKNVLEAGCKALDDHYERNGITNVRNYAIKNRPGWYKPQYKLDKKKRAVLIDLSSTKLAQREKDYIVSKYQSLDGLQDNDISIEIGSKHSKSYDTVMTVTAPIVPIKGHSEIVTMFALAEETGVAAVMPMVSKHGRIQDMGVVKTSDGPKKLFCDVAYDRNDFFGSFEWVRNVDEVSSTIHIKKSQTGKSDTRCVVWVHAEYSSFDVGDRTAGVRARQQLAGLYNPNVSEIANITQRATDYITDKLEEKP